MPAEQANGLTANGPPRRVVRAQSPRPSTLLLSAATLLAAAGVPASLAGDRQGAEVERAPWFRLITPDQRLPDGFGAHWRETPLNEAASRLRQATGRVLWIDRRVDPLTKINVSHAPGGSWDELAQRLAASVPAASSATTTGATPTVAGTLYLGPDAGTLLTRIANRLEEVDRLPRRNRRDYLARDAIAWPRLTEPRPLIASLLEEKGIACRTTDRIPHDLWPAQRLPPAPMADQLTLLLCGFGLDWRIEDRGRGVRLVQAVEPAALTATHRLPPDRNVRASELAELLGRGAEVRLARDRVTLRGTVEQHARLRGALSPETTTNPAKDNPAEDGAPRPDTARLRDQRFTLRVIDQPPLPVIRALAEQAGLRLQIAPEAEGALKRRLRIRLEVSNATIDELLAAWARAAGVSVERRGTVLVVAP